MLPSLPIRKQAPRQSFQSSKGFNKNQVSTLSASSNQTTQYFSFRIQNKISPDDATLAWTYNVPVLNPNEKQLFLTTESFTTILQDFIGDNYPQTISIALRNYGGLIGWNGSVTNKIIVLNLASITTHGSNGIVQRDLVYKNDIQAMWNLGTLRNLQFQVYVDENPEPVQFPIQNSIALIFKIIHLSM